MLTTDQQQFATRLAADTGLSTQVIAAWMLAEESGGAAQSRQSAHNNDWLNIGYTDSGTYGSSDSIWSNPVTAADATAGWLKGQDTIPGYGRAAAGIQAIMKTAGQSPQAQMSAIQNSGWASGGYPALAQLFSQVALSGRPKRSGPIPGVRPGMGLCSRYRRRPAFALPHAIQTRRLLTLAREPTPAARVAEVDDEPDDEPHAESHPRR